ncbi:hypothetical protein MYX65_05055 [Acidobacteria bacterium AH-259-L09]|nr:hypothetical protein [Acidobacteria bacterium AH-259-L09]
MLGNQSNTKVVFRLLPLLFVFALTPSLVQAKAWVDLSEGVIVIPENLSKVEENAVDLLREEVEKRTLIRLEVRSQWPASSIPVIAVGPTSRQREFLGPIDGGDLPKQTAGAEGYRVFIGKEGREAPAVWLVGNDSRGVLFAVGRLLREMRLSRNRILAPADMRLSTAPAYPLRGHQLGYRPKANSYDAFTAEMWDQYIRDLVVFGTNAIEMIPPRSDDDADSPHFPLPQIDMMARVSEISDGFDVDVWIWYPALDRDYSDPATVEFALKEWGEVFKKIRRLDVVFVPGGDPGHTQPKFMMAMLEKQVANLKQYHPEAEIWMSPQGFVGEWMEEFYEILRIQEPGYLAGIVYGPQIRVSLPELRKTVSSRYPIRRYPDITHSLRSQYAVPDWDLAYALTEARECINPRPRDEAKIFRALEDQAIGFLTYSEGVNDDVNKIIWSFLGWEPDGDVVEALRQYSRYYIGPQYEDDFSQGLLALEQNWKGPLATNEGVYSTLKQFQEMEREASPAILLNWRFQQALYRAYYDAYTRARLLYETALEDRAMEFLRQAPEIGSLQALGRAAAVLEKADVDRVAQDWRLRIYQLAEALFQSIRMQLSVNLYQAISVGRGANLDTLDVPLNNRAWLLRQFDDIRGIDSEEGRLSKIAEVVDWTNPGPGGFYDDLGNLTGQPHLVGGLDYAEDPAFFETPVVGFRCQEGWRLSWCRHADNLYDSSLQLRYTDLDREAAYEVRIVYAGDARYHGAPVKVRLVADDSFEIHPLMDKPNPVQPVEFDIAKEATRDGEVVLTCTSKLGRGGAGRGCQIGEIWLVKKR